MIFFLWDVCIGFKRRTTYVCGGASPIFDNEQEVRATLSKLLLHGDSHGPVNPAHLKGATEEDLRDWLFHLMITMCRKQIGVEVETIDSSDMRRTFIVLRISEDLGRQIAHEMKYPLQLQAPTKSKCPAVPHKHFDLALESPQGMKQGSVWRRYSRVGATVPDGSPTNQFKKIHASSIFSDIDRARLILRSLERLFNLEHLQSRQIIDGLFLPPRYDAGRKMGLTQIQSLVFYKSSMGPDIDELREYMGEDIALYFAFLGFCVRSLITPSVLSLLIIICRFLFDFDFLDSFRSYDLARFFICIFNAGWLTHLQLKWQYNEDLLAIKWGSKFFDSAVTEKAVRQTFIKDSVTVDPANPARWIDHYSPSKKKLRICLSSICTFMAVVSAIAIVNDEIRDALLSSIGLSDFIDTAMSEIISPFLPHRFSPKPLIVALLAYICNCLWRILSEKLTDFENHRYHDRHERSLIKKLFLFAACDYFIPLYYLAFIKMYIDPCYAEDPHEGRCLRSLGSQIGWLLVVSLLSNFLEIGQPYLMRELKNWWRKRRAESPVNSPPDLRFIESEFNKASFTHTRDDYQELFFILMIVTFFSPAYPILNVVGFVILLLEIKVDALKILFLSRRPLSRPCQDIGAWSGLLRVCVNLAIATNVALCAMAGLGRTHTLNEKLLLLIVCTVLCYFSRETVKAWRAQDKNALDLVKQQCARIEHEAQWGQEEEYEVLLSTYRDKIPTFRDTTHEDTSHWNTSHYDTSHRETSHYEPSQRDKDVFQQETL